MSFIGLTEENLWSLFSVIWKFLKLLPYPIPPIQNPRNAPYYVSNRMTIWDLAVSRYRRNPFTSLHSSCPLVRCLSPSTILEYPPDDRGPGLSIYLYNYCQFTSHTSNFTCLTILAVFELFCNRVNILYLFFLITI